MKAPFQAISKINPFEAASSGTFGVSGAGPAQFADNVSKTSFKDLLGNLVVDTNNTISAPDGLMNRALTTGDVDIHEVMIANTKADIAVNMASQVITKVIQAYERVQQIQV